MWAFHPNMISNLDNVEKIQPKRMKNIAQKHFTSVLRSEG